MPFYTSLNSGALWQGSSTENWAKSLKLSRMTAGYFIDTKFGMVTHTVNSNLKPLLFFKKVTWLSMPGVKTIQIWPPNFGSKRQSEGYLQNLQKMALTAWDRVYFSNPTGSFENRHLLFLRGVIYHLLFTVVKINDPLTNNRYLFSKEPVGFEKYTLSQAVRAIFHRFWR